MMPVAGTLQVDLDRHKSEEDQVKQHLEGIKLMTSQMKSEHTALEQRAARAQQKWHKVRHSTLLS